MCAKKSGIGALASFLRTESAPLLYMPIASMNFASEIMRIPFSRTAQSNSISPMRRGAECSARGANFGRFPDDFYREIFRLRHGHRSGVHKIPLRSRRLPVDARELLHGALDHLAGGAVRGDDPGFLHEGPVAGGGGHLAAFRPGRGHHRGFRRRCRFRFRGPDFGRPAAFPGRQHSRNVQPRRRSSGNAAGRKR